MSLRIPCGWARPASTLAKSRNPGVSPNTIVRSIFPFTRTRRAAWQWLARTARGLRAFFREVFPLQRSQCLRQIHVKLPHPEQLLSQRATQYQRRDI